MDIMALKSKADRQADRRMGVSEYGKSRLLTYADSFRELARSLEGEFDGEGTDRQSFLAARKLWENKQVLCDNLNEVAQIMTRVASEVFRYRPLGRRSREPFCTP